MQYLWTKLNSDDPCPPSRNLSKENNWHWCNDNDNGIQLATLRIACFCTCTSKTFCLNYVHIVRIGFRLEMCTCWVLTRVCFILATSHHYWSAQIIIDYFGLAFADTRRVEGHLFWGNIWLLRRPRPKDYLRQLEKLHGVGLAWQYIASQSNRLLLCICQDCVMSTFEKKTKYKMKLDLECLSMLQGQQPRYCIINSTSNCDSLWSYLLNHTFLLLFIQVFHFLLHPKVNTVPRIHSTLNIMRVISWWSSGTTEEEATIQIERSSSYFASKCHILGETILKSESIFS